MSEQYNELMRIAGDTVLAFERNGSRLALCPKLGGRIFAAIGDLCPHRLDLGSILEPTREFNNFGGGNFWPAPEGGKFGFNYDGDRWRVQSAINLQPFELVERGDDTATIGKRVSLVNRAGIVIEADMVRRLRLASEADVSLSQYPLEYYMAYITEDSFEILNHVRPESALIGAWTLEQFAASADTISFCQVRNPEGAINYDFYDHPGERIRLFPTGFTYRTDGLSMGQIGVAVGAKAGLIGFYNLSTRMLCIRRNLSDRGNAYFNIADNDQPNGPYSAADNYSIYNSGPEMGAFELETVGAACIDDGRLVGSFLVSETAFAVFREVEDLKRAVDGLLGLQQNTQAT